MELHPVGPTAELCSGCEPQMTPAYKQPAASITEASYIPCDPRQQCCPRPQASAYARFSLAAVAVAGGAGIGSAAIRTMQEAWQFIKQAEAKQEELPEGTKASPEIVNLSLEASKKYRGLAALAQYHGDTSLSVFATRRQAAAISMALKYNEKGVDPRHDQAIA
ncbi:MAG: hypothetical protein HYU98_01505, partial [Deltaproteobacteria bacterium]|nr:hypothetical protein [Deltaproteobacteria bacterium]